MDDRRRIIDELFDAALDVPAAERLDFVAARAPDGEVRAAVKRLLDALDDTALMDSSPWRGQLGAQMAMDLRLDPAQEGERIGAYRIVRELGRGGMASVYLAERADGHFDQEVALKLATTVASPEAEILRRFHVERQILASLDHPNIARLVDGGLTDDGRPYFAMERIDGAPIDRFCDDGRLSIRDRLRLMADVARAVEAAHRALVVHRDIKPSNVLVTADGVVKLLDFGIAKSFADAEAPALTRTSTSMMTPEYASPEQFRGELVTTASDIYQLGLLLYQLLAGERPYSLAGLAPVQVQEVICETAPERPSTRLTRLLRSGSEQVEQISSLRQTRPGELRRLLAGDLDTLVLKALRKEPDRRYASAAELADDIERFLDGRPIRARGDSPGYLLQKFLQRHAAVATAAGLALLTLITVVAFYTVRLGEERNAARLEARRAAEARDQAQQARLEAEETTEFLVGLFEQSDPWDGEGGDLTARELLTAGADQIRRQLDGQPLTQARLMDTIGGVYRRLGLYDEAQPLLEDALALREDNAAGRSALADSFYGLAYFHHEQADLDRAKEFFEKALGLLMGVHGEGHLELAKVINGLSQVARRQGRLEDAEALQRQVIDIESEALGLDHLETLRSRANLANLFSEQGRPREAVELFEEVLAKEEALLGEEDMILATTLNNFANAYDGLGEAERNLELLVRAQAIKEKALGPEHPVVAAGLVNLGPAYGDAGRAQEGEAALQRAVSIFEAKAPDHPGLGNVYTNLASMRLAADDLPEAERYFRLALDHRVRTLGTDHPDVGAAVYNLGELVLRQGRPRDALREFDRALDLWRAALREDHPYLGFGYTSAAEVSRDLGDSDRAFDLFSRAHAILSVKVGPKHEMRQRAADGYAAALDARGRPQDAAEVRASLAESDDASG
ncbi:MAG: serine/threonine-protein kinase [Acidobacteriota bacterium]